MKREEPEVVPAPLPQPPPSPLTTTTAAAAVTPVVEEPFVVNSSKETRGRKRTRHDSAPDAVEEKKTNKNSSVANDFGVRRRGRPPRNAGNSDTTAPTKKKKGDVIHWVCCDLCSKWRIVPEKIPADTAEWHCVMRADGTTCSDTDDEVRMNHSKKKR
ncbi:hypothetical protein DQ04_07011050 [Trypanosoma grayi]|uniref:hypothetical protein n=1 Tax=Trypanosoma grayi TaxID=71804 RepID=UPI0004F41AD7|nr:hypothetical protein DQ04_07011050 [Trypanosoma grayi]KEG08514.1 hypothetical protein DQ04_07011050 [Trypanosoma grayi]